jgi:cytochrome P450 family 135
MPAAPGLPPGPPLPRAAQGLAMLGPAMTFMQASRRRYGDPFTLSLPLSPPSVVVAEPALLREVFTAPAGVLKAGESNAFLGPLVGDRSVLLLDGPEHLRERRLLLPPFHGERIARYEAIVSEATERAVANWPSGEAFPLLPSMQALTLEVILRAVLGIEDAARREQFTALTRAVLAPLWTNPAALFAMFALGRRPRGAAARRQAEFAARVAALDAALYAEIARRRAEGGLDAADDVLAMLLSAHDEDGRPMTDREVRDETVTLLLAGHETTATALAWAFERLVRTPRALSALTADLAAGSDRWLDATIRETLRMRPIIPAVGRVVAEPFALAGHVLPPGTEISPSVALLHYRSDLYPRPRAFRPERFLDRQPGTYEWIPFGGGSRRCLGASFALMEMRGVLRQVLMTTELEPAREARERVVRRGIVLAPVRGAEVVALRSPPPATVTRLAAAPDPSARAPAAS